MGGLGKATWVCALDGIALVLIGALCGLTYIANGKTSSSSAFYIWSMIENLSCFGPGD